MATMRKKGNDGRDADATLQFGLRAPAVDGSAAQAPPLRLYSRRQHLSRFIQASTTDTAGFRFDNFVRNLKGMRTVVLEGEPYDILFTRSSAFLSYEGLPGKLALLSGIISPDSRLRISVATSPEGGILTLCRLSARDLKAVLGASEGPKASLSEGEFLHGDDRQEIDAPSFREKMRRCEILSTGPEFDARAFVESIDVVSVFRDERGSGYLVIGVKGDDTVYAIHVNATAPPVDDQNPLVCRMRYGNDAIAIFRIDVIG